MAEDPALQDDRRELADLGIGVPARVREERGDDVRVARDVAQRRLGAASHVVVRRQERGENLGKIRHGGSRRGLVRLLRAHDATHGETRVS